MSLSLVGYLLLTIAVVIVGSQLGRPAGYVVVGLAVVALVLALLGQTGVLR